MGKRRHLDAGKHLVSFTCLAITLTAVAILKRHYRLVIRCPPYKPQNPSEPQNTSRNARQIPIQNRNAEKLRKIYESHPISCIFVFCLYFGFWRGIWRAFRDVFWGSEGFCTLYEGRMIATIDPSLGVRETLTGILRDKGNLIRDSSREQISRISKPAVKTSWLVTAHRKHSDFYDLRLRCPSRTPEI